MSTYAEDHLVEQPAIQLMQHELGWEGGNIEHRTPNIEHRREEMKMIRTSPARLRLNPELPLDAVDGAVGEEILNGRFWILNGGGR